MKSELIKEKQETVKGHFYMGASLFKIINNNYGRLS